MYNKPLFYETPDFETDSAENAKFLAKFLKTVRSVKKITIECSSIAKEPVEEYDWINPSRPATEEEIEQMLDECEKSPLLTSKEARELTQKKLKDWKEKQK